MAVDLGFTSISGQQIQGGVSSTVLGMIVVFGLVFLGGLIWLWLWYKKYNKVVMVRKIVNDGVKVFTDKCRYLKDKEGVEWWKFLSLRKKVKIPPSDCIDTTIGGKDHAICDLYPTGEIQWVKSIRGNKETASIIEPFTTEDRQTLQYQFWKANLEGGINWKDLIIPIFGIIALVIITVSLMIFYKDMGEPLLAMADKIEAYQNTNLQILDKMGEIINQTQTIQLQRPIPVSGIIPSKGS